MKTWDKFYDYVLPDVPNAPQDVALFQIRNAAIEFCERSYVYTYQTDGIAVTAGEPEYVIDVPTSYDSLSLNGVYLDGKPISPVAEDRLQRIGTQWQDDTGEPVAYLQKGTKVVRLYPTPIADGELKATVVLAPTRTSTGIEDWVFNRYVDVIASGAKAKLMSMQQKPYTNPTMAMMHLNDFRSGITRARIAASKSFTNTDTAVLLRKHY